MSVLSGKSTSPISAPHTGTVLRLAWPMALKAVLLHGAVVIDGWLVSSLGELQLAALGLAAAVAGFPLGAILAFSHAMQIKTAQTYGRGNHALQKLVLVSGLIISCAIGALLILLAMVLDDFILEHLSPDPLITSYAISYLSVFFFFIFGESISQCLSSYFNGCGRTKIPLYGFCLSVPVNIFTSLILIHGLFGLPAYGVVGAALGSVIGTVVQLIFLFAMLYRVDNVVIFTPLSSLSTTAASTIQQFLFSLPIATTFMSATFSGRVAELMYAKMSLTEFAAMIIITPWIMVAGTIAMQWSQATGIIVAQLLGQGASPEILSRFLSRAWRGVFIAAAIVACLYSLLCMSAPFIYSNLSAETTSLIMSFLPILLFLPFIRSTNAICGNTLRASGDTIYVMKLFLYSQWLFRLPAMAIAIFYFDLSAFWVLSILLLEEIIKFPPFHLRLYSGRWKTAAVH